MGYIITGKVALRFITLPNITAITISIFTHCACGAIINSDIIVNKRVWAYRSSTSGKYSNFAYSSASNSSTVPKKIEYIEDCTNTHIYIRINNKMPHLY